MQGLSDSLLDAGSLWNAGWNMAGVHCLQMMPAPYPLSISGLSAEPDACSQQQVDSDVLQYFTVCSVPFRVGQNDFS